MTTINYVILFFLAFSLVGHALHTVWKIRKHLHMMQLNSYFNHRYWVWLLRRKLQTFAVKDLEPLIALVGLFFSNLIIVLVLFSLIYWRLFLILPEKVEKKPLVFTSRAIRLLVVNLVLLVISYLSLFAVWWAKGDFWFQMSLGFLVLYNFLIPFVLMLVNWLLVPVEKLIQRNYFIRAANYVDSLPNLIKIGITGSFGKTTTKYVLTEILSRKFNTIKTPGSYNTTMGVTKIILSELKPIHDVFVVEMGAKKPGDINELCKLVKPTYGLITALGEQHLETFKSFENIKKTKSELIKGLPKDGIAFFNFDDPNCRELVELAKCQVILYGIDSLNADYKVTNIKLNEQGSNFEVICKKDNSKEAIQIPLLGKHNIYNVLAAIAIAAEIGVKLSEMVYPLRNIAQVPHRLELKKITNNIIFIDDAFNSNPVGSKMAIDVLQEMIGDRKIVVTPGMIELGSKEKEYNQLFGEQIASVCDYVILVGEEQAFPIQQGLNNKNYPAERIFIANDFACAKKYLESILQNGDVVLFENDLPDNYGSIV